MKHIAWVIGALVLGTAFAVIKADRRGLFDHVSKEERHELQALSPAGKYFGDMCIQDGYSEGMLKAIVRLFGTEPAMLGMFETLKLSNANARACAAWCLGHMGDPKAIAPLEIASQDTVEFVRTTAAEALHRLRGQTPQRERAEIHKRKKRVQVQIEGNEQRHANNG